MAATVSAWGKPGSWALDSEENEAELHQDKQSKGGDRGEKALSDFPSLATAAATKTKKKKKAQPLSLQEFSSYGSSRQETISLPTAPRERTAEELDRSRIGGGFRSYGSSSYDRPARGSSDESLRQGRIGSRDFTPSRADETDNWAANKAFVPSDGARRVERRGGFEPNGGGADSDSWTKRKEPESRKFGSGNVEDWGRKREDGNGNNGRPRLNLQPRTIPLGEGQQNGNGSPAKPKGSNPFGEARPREEVLKEKEIEQKLDSLKIKDGGKKKSSSIGSSNGQNSPEDSTRKSWRRFDWNDSRVKKTGGSVEESIDEKCNEGQEDKN